MEVVEVKRNVSADVGLVAFCQNSQLFWVMLLDAEPQPQGIFYSDIHLAEYLFC